MISEYRQSHLSSDVLDEEFLDDGRRASTDRQERKLTSMAQEYRGKGCDRAPNGY